MGHCSSLYNYLTDKDLIQLMRCCHLLYDKEYSKLTLQHTTYSASHIVLHEKQHKVQKLRWDIQEESKVMYKETEWPYVKELCIVQSFDKFIPTLGLNTTLTTIDLSINNIEDVGASSIAEALKVNTTLTCIN